MFYATVSGTTGTNRREARLWRNLEALAEQLSALAAFAQLEPKIVMQQLQLHYNRNMHELHRLTMIQELQHWLYTEARIALDDRDEATPIPPAE